MKKSRYTEGQVAYALRLAESGTPVVDVCRQTGIAEATFYCGRRSSAASGCPRSASCSRCARSMPRDRASAATLRLRAHVDQAVWLNLVDLAATITRFCHPGGTRAVITDNLLLKHQLLVAWQGPPAGGRSVSVKGTLRETGHRSANVRRSV